MIENRSVLQTGRKHCGKRRNCSLQAISPFPTVFSKDLYCMHIDIRAWLGKGEKHFGKWGKCFPHFPTMFSKVYFLWVVEKFGLRGKE